MSGVSLLHLREALWQAYTFISTKVPKEVWSKIYAASYREVLFDYLKGRWSQEDIQKYIKFSTVVRDVVYNKATDDFTVSVKDLKNDEVIDGER